MKWWGSAMFVGVVVICSAALYLAGYQAGVRENRDAMLCTLDRLVYEQKAPTKYCKRFDSIRKVRP